MRDVMDDGFCQNQRVLSCTGMAFTVAATSTKIGSNSCYSCRDGFAFLLQVDAAMATSFPSVVQVHDWCRSMVFARKWCYCEIFEGGEVGSEKMEIAGARNCGGADLFEGGTVMKLMVLPWMRDAISGVVATDLAGAS
ncbi:hypothetical protein DEO72_LG6g648 [Vigna unguiculata]|uniref:Uncharacterized protein n=1 Tax=Vigna unguiculata TaxID=3917 RepID=A0A4D6M5I1_VIGUN|nr:hypothetical protein DEO72_LG6g648 [Vigna unguiculata]